MGDGWPGWHERLLPALASSLSRSVAHGNWGSWGTWGPCSATCSPEGAGLKPQQRRRRVCNSPTPSKVPPGLPCPGSDSEDQACPGLPYCPVDGSWSAWKPLGPCSVTCGLGRIMEKRFCNNPAPQHGGKNCPGLDTQSHFCNTKTPCPGKGAGPGSVPWMGVGEGTHTVPGREGRCRDGTRGAGKKVQRLDQEEGNMVGCRDGGRDEK
uniref:Spondin-like TSP1 domain-containing protein n=1 Tax=Pelodiscus sinensis TaxID=13735 RepID=K7FKD3_PELSI